MGEKRVVDLSMFLRFEAAGDSEADNLDAISAVDDHHHHHHHGNAYGSVHDDAESCSSDVDVNFDQKLVNHHRREEEEEEEDLDDGIGDEEENAAIHGIDRRRRRRDHDDDDDEMWEKEMASEVESTANSYATRKRCKRKMTEIEKSRLFWEACLAS